MAGKVLVVSGKRKTAIAKVKIREGKGNVLYNSLPYEKLEMFHKLSIAEPIKIAERQLGNFNFDVNVKTTGGGKESQVQAARLGIAKALVKFTKDKELKDAFVKYDRHLLVADTRRKEQCKPGDSKARAMRQSSKR